MTELEEALAKSAFKARCRYEKPDNGHDPDGWEQLPEAQKDRYRAEAAEQLQALKEDDHALLTGEALRYVRTALEVHAGMDQHSLNALAKIDKTLSGVEPDGPVRQNQPDVGISMSGS